MCQDHTIDDDYLDGPEIRIEHDAAGLLTLFLDEDPVTIITDTTQARIICQMIHAYGPEDGYILARGIMLGAHLTHHNHIINICDHAHD